MLYPFVICMVVMIVAVVFDNAIWASYAEEMALYEEDYEEDYE